MSQAMDDIRPCGVDDQARILGIINAAAEAYRGVIPDDCWHEPYFDEPQLEREVAAGVRFSGFEREGQLIGVMGIQAVDDVDLLRHAYVLPGYQQHGIGGRLIAHLTASTTRPMLVGTWAAAEWAIRFYQRHGFELVTPEQKTVLLGRYWTITARQIETSVVLVRAG